MSGAFTLLEKIDDRDVHRVLQRLSEKADNLHPCLKNMGQHLQESTKERFSEEKDPAGIRWAALRDSTVSRKKGSKILTEKSELSGNISYSVHRNSLRVGTNKIYGATHQFGRDLMPAHRRTVTTAYGNKLKFPVWAEVRSYNPKIPARPFLGISASDREELIAIVHHYLDE